jgi:hypothetical protein
MRSSTAKPCASERAAKEVPLLFYAFFASEVERSTAKQSSKAAVTFPAQEAYLRTRAELVTATLRLAQLPADAVTNPDPQCRECDPRTGRDCCLV